ncbi:MAG: LapA family protein [Proteobacteria bacterium]|uniref:lipopolysaccharide assembly LapA domain-containing protein n=1 Tax=Aquabacterium sp. TaxID=1872578 RepID=UPI0035C6E4BD|nr:LapA family protein [Pseudomonadota bacterium]
MRALTWLWRGLLFFLLFAFALNNQHVVDVKWMFGWHWQAPMVFVVLAVFALGCATGVLSMVPSWWRHRRDARNRQLLMPEPVAGTPKAGANGSAAVTADGSLGGEASLPGDLPFPPDMPAPRKPAK